MKNIRKINTVVKMLLMIPTVLSILFSCEERRDLKKYSQSLRSSIRQDFILYQPDSALLKARKLMEITSEDFCREEYISSLVYIGQAYLMLKETDSMNSYFTRATDLALRYNDYWALGTIYNALGVLYKSDVLSSTNAVKYFLTGLSYATKTKDDILVSNLKCNLAITYYMRRDPEGLKYALEVYESGKDQSDEYLKFAGAFVASYLYYELENYDSAMHYIVEAMPISENIETDLYSLWTIYGDILMAKGEEDMALQYYRKALQYDSCSNKRIGIDVYLSYGRYLKIKQEYDSALSVLKRGMELSDSTFNNINAYKLYIEAADVCSLMNDDAQAEIFRSIYKEYEDSIFSYRNERVISNDKLTYYKDVYEKSLNVAGRKTAMLILFSVLSLAIVCLFWWVWHKYSQRKLLESLKGIKKHEFDPDISDSKMKAMFAELETLMREKHIYSDRNITREKIADMLLTNRTYITKMIHVCTGMNLSAYINKYRIDEAARILSDSNDKRSNKEIAADLGFSSVSNFYKLFGAAIGMSPTQYKNRKNQV